MLTPSYSQTRTAGPFASIAVGLYAWVTAVFLGISLLDIIYSRLAPPAAAAFPKVADLLLLATSFIFLLALIAIWLSWRATTARAFLIASLGVSLLGSFAPVILSPLVPAGSAAGPAIRIFFGVSVSILAFAASFKLRPNG